MLHLLRMLWLNQRPNGLNEGSGGVRQVGETVGKQIECCHSPSCATGLAKPDALADGARGSALSALPGRSTKGL